MEPPLKFQQLNSKLSHMKHFPEVSKSDLQLVKILLGHFLGMFQNQAVAFLQWKSMEVL